MFGTLFFERDPLRLADLPSGFVSWIQDAGGFAAVGILLWLVFGYTRLRPVDRARIPSWQSTLFLLAVVGAALCYTPVLALGGYDLISSLSEEQAARPAVPQAETRGAVLFRTVCLTAGGVCALIAVLLPFCRNAFGLRGRRIWAITRLSFKEAIRRRVLYAFSGLLLVFLFASWFIPNKPEYQVQTYVTVVFWCMTALLLFAAIIISAFSIPTDLKQQTIHTILTKPVERFEVVLGRFLGFLGLMTLVLIVMTGVSLLYVLRGVTPEAAEESLKAREPLYGDLRFENTKSERRAESVGREWEYRSYITSEMPGQRPEEAPVAIWDFPDLPSRLGDRDQVRLEFNFDVYRTHKGEENRGLSCAFFVRTRHYVAGNDEKYRKALEAHGQPNPPVDPKIADELTEQFGYYEDQGKSITDYHTQNLELPGGLFRNARRTDLEPRQQRDGSPAPALQVRVRCNSTQQYVGVAKYDLYLRLDNTEGGAEKMLFAANFFKGAFGLWLVLALLIGLAVALSTYLSGVIALLIVLMLYLGGQSLDFIRKVAAGTNVGGGPVESTLRIAQRSVAAAPLEETGGKRAAVMADNVFRWVIRRVLDVIPDVDRFDFAPSVASGFNIPFLQLFLSFLLLVAYLAPWALLGYYLIKWREVASSS